MVTLTKPQKELKAIIESEGATVVAVYKGGKSIKVDYTFDHVHFHTQFLPTCSALSRRWASNFRSEIRKTKRGS